ncbi:MAG: UDP-N-acetylmuramoyl-L-alanine--D-glutamate ligase [Bacteroidales bacterium]|nr:UDP-N-acetylmuramoyl-L-alanine--D-glutamate ligase [Bacteroidales bacterium]
MSQQEKYDFFRSIYQKFIYDSYHYDVQSDGLHISFCFLIDNGEKDGNKITFCPTAFFPARPFLHPERLDSATLDTLVFNIGMIELISYWKCYCPPIVEIKPFRLNDKQIAFWKKLYFNGLGEFFYTNGISATIDDFMAVVSDENRPAFDKCNDNVLIETSIDNHIIPIGGGKDSVVTLEILGGGATSADKSFDSRPIPLIMNPRGATTECIKKAGYTLDDVIVIKRTIDPLLLQFNKEGSLNGHTPFSAMLAFYTILASALTGNRCNIALSNESSANESTVSGTNVNHQYSKSLEFEDDFRGYVSSFIGSKFNYYSLLRPLSELQIAMLFSHYTHYHDVFKSCNAGSKEDIWCGKCAKCLFAYIILSPFIDPKRLNTIFGKNMLDDVSLKTEFKQLIGEAETKPFECVGTVSEVNDALSMAISKWYPEMDSRPALLKDYLMRPITNDLQCIQRQNNVTKSDFDALSKNIFSPLHFEANYAYKELYNIFFDKNILIAGYGREGQSTHKLLQRLFPRKHFDIAHNNDEIDEALSGKHYDLIMKSPGIPSFFFEGKCEMMTISSQTDVFLKCYRNHPVFGITGTKGKSTTASLLQHVMQTAGYSSVFAGNIGIPLFDIIEQITPNTPVVAELSCHQLENISQGPAYGAVLNLFPEHLDHYHSYDDYENAKMQMALKQTENQRFYYCADNYDLVTKVEAMRCNIPSQIVSYCIDEAKQETFLVNAQTELKGLHNLSNIYLVWLIAKDFGVSQKVFLQALESFHPLEHRLEKVCTIDGVTYYNDSISTIPQTTIAALEALKNVDTLILGGFNRGIDYKPLADYLVNAPLGKAVRNLVLFGTAGKAIYEQGRENIEQKAGNILCHFDSDYSMAEAVDFAAKYTAKGKICLLSPAASSYDHYKNFEFRGCDFKEEVQKLKNK